MDRFEKVINILAIITITLMVVLAVIFIITFKEMLNDYRCGQLPINEFFQDEKCERYWDFRKWEQ